MIIAIFLALLGAFLARFSRVFMIIPVALVFTLGIFAYWAATGQLSWLKALIWVGFIAALNTGYLFGMLFHTGESREHSAGSSKKKNKAAEQDEFRQLGHRDSWSATR